MLVGSIPSLVFCAHNIMLIVVVVVVALSSVADAMKTAPATAQGVTGVMAVTTLATGTKGPWSFVIG